MLSTTKGIRMLRKFMNKKKNSVPNGAIHEAVKSCDIKTLVRLIARGADVNAYNGQGVTPLHVASEIGNADLALILISLGADVHLASSGEKGCVPALVVAATHGNGECVRVLLESGAAPDASDKWGNTALFKSSTYNHITCVKLLLHYGATPDLSNQWGATPLQYAVLQGYTDIVRLLLSFGANPNLPGEKNYHSPVQAAVSKHYDCLDLLVEGGADVNTTMPSGVKLLSHVISEGTDISNDLYSTQLLLESGAQTDSDCIKALSRRYFNQFYQDSVNNEATDSEKLGHDLYNLVIMILTSLPSCDCRHDPRMHRALSCLYEVLHSMKSFDCVSLLVKLGFMPTHLDLPRPIAEELGLLKQTESLMTKTVKVVQNHIKDLSKIHELPLPLCLIKSLRLHHQ